MEHSGRQVSRRRFLRDAAAGAALTAAAPALAGFPWIRIGRRTKLNVAWVGCGGKGASDVAGVAAAGARIVALCDVDYQRAQGTFRRFPKAKKYKDYRKMLEEMHRDIDAVGVSTPDHMHFPVAMMALELGKHLYVQKPLTRTIWEARELARMARRKGVATQMGNQGHANEGTRLVYEWIRSGAIGPVRKVYLYTDRPIWPQKIRRWPDAQVPPPTLDWNLWLGVAQERPYHSGYHPFQWRGWWDFGTGALGDMGCHIMDASFWALDLRNPEWVEAQSDADGPDVTPTWSIVTYHFGPRNGMPPVDVVWLDGKKQPPRPEHLEKGRRLPRGNGQIIIGDKATIIANVNASSAWIVPESRRREVGKPPKMLERVKGGHYKEWVRACLGGRPAGSNFPDHAGPLTETVLLGNLAIRTGKRVYWDAEHLRCSNAPEADAFIRTPYRMF